MKAYSMDLRERALALSDEGFQTKAVADRLKVSPGWVRKLKRKHKSGESIEPRSPGGSKPKLDDAGRQSLARFVDEQPDAILEELKDRVAKELKIGVCVGTLWNTLKAMKLPLKKSRSRRASRHAQT